MRKNLRRWVLGAVFLLLISNFLPKMTEAKIYGTISGKVIAEDTGKGVKDAYVSLSPINEKTGHLMGPRIVKADEEGRFLFKNLSEGKYLLAVEPPPPYYGDEGYVLWGKYDKVDTIILKKGGVVYNFVKVVKVGGSVSGRVTKGDGSGFPGVSVFAWTIGCTRSSETSSDGSFKIGGLMPSDEYEIKVTLQEGDHPLYHDEWRRSRKGIKVEARKETMGIDFKIDLDDPTGIEGIVTSSDGKPVEKAIIMVRIEEGNETMSGWTFTNNEGRYSIQGLSPGYGVVSVYFPINEQEIYEEKEVYISKGRKSEANFVLEIKMQ